MFKFLFLIFLFFVLFVFFFGFSIVRTIFGGLFRTRPTQHSAKSEQQQKKSPHNPQQKTPSSQKKIFEKDEGEYIEYEEIKD